MEYIINPWWFYLIDMIAKANTFFLVTTIIAGVITMRFFAWSINEKDTDKDIGEGKTWENEAEFYQDKKKSRKKHGGVCLYLMNCNF